jgi:Ran-binding protein 3
MYSTSEQTLTMHFLVETGEEGEETIFSCKAKLLYNDGKEWKERGMGTFKVNVSEDSYDNHSEEAQKRTARLIMRTEGVFRVILNTPVFKGMKVGNLSGKKPEGKTVYFTVIENGKPVSLVLKVTFNISFLI